MDPERLIELVREYPAIWDRNYKFYNDRLEKNTSWLMVCKALHSDFDDLDPEDKEMCLTECRNKWRNIKDNYIKVLNRGGYGTKKKKYVYADALAFFKDSLDMKNLPTNDVDDGSQERKILNKEVVLDRLEARPSLDVTPFWESPLPHKQTKSPVDLENFEERLLRKIESRVEEGDADKAFLMSLLPKIRNLDEDNKLRFQMYALQFFIDLKKKESE